MKMTGKRLDMYRETAKELGIAPEVIDEYCAYRHSGQRLADMPEHLQQCHAQLKSRDGAADWREQRAEWRAGKASRRADAIQNVVSSSERKLEGEARRENNLQKSLSSHRGASATHRGSKSYHTVSDPDSVKRVEDKDQTRYSDGKIHPVT